MRRDEPVPPAERPYLVTQLGRVRDGGRVHPATRRSLELRGLVDRGGLTVAGWQLLDELEVRFTDDGGA